MGTQQGRERIRRVLTVDDDPAALALLGRQLRAAGYEVASCSTGQAALTAITDAGADIVIADWLTPGLNGPALCRAVNELREKQAIGCLYVVLLAGGGDKEKLVQAFEAGADDFLSKPYDPDELLARIRAGERVLRLQDELIHRQLKLSKANAELAILNRELTKLANTDTLTDLPNRRSALLRFHDAWALARRRGRPLSCLMADVDRFKRINDTYGHSAGDLVLRRLAQIIRGRSRCYDICGRVGGEEFLVVCPEETTAGAAALAERLRLATEQEPFQTASERISVTISLGVATMRPAHTNPEALMTEADAMLYAAKQHGRNQVRMADAAGNARRFEQSPNGSEGPDARVAPASRR